MALTVSSHVFRCSRKQALFVAECANLRYEVTSTPRDGEDVAYPLYYGGRQAYDMWQDRQTGGGGCRIVWKHDVAWVSRHSGYPQADITDDVCEFFAEIGCSCINGHDIWRKNPNILGGSS